MSSAQQSVASSSQQNAQAQAQWTEDDLLDWIDEDDLDEDKVEEYRQVLKYLVLIQPDAVQKAIRYVQRGKQRRNTTKAATTSSIRRSTSGSAHSISSFSILSTATPTQTPSKSGRLPPMTTTTTQHRESTSSTPSVLPPQRMTQESEIPTAPISSGQVVLKSPDHNKQQHDHPPLEVAMTSMSPSQGLPPPPPPQSTFATATTTLMVLCTSQPRSKKQGHDQDLAMQLCRTAHVLPLIVLRERHADQASRLMGISKVVQFPQFFVVHRRGEADNNNHRAMPIFFLGDYDTVHFFYSSDPDFFRKVLQPAPSNKPRSLDAIFPGSQANLGYHDEDDQEDSSAHSSTSPHPSKAVPSNNLASSSSSSPYHHLEGLHQPSRSFGGSSSDDGELVPNNNNQDDDEEQEQSLGSEGIFDPPAPTRKTSLLEAAKKAAAAAAAQPQQQQQQQQLQRESPPTTVYMSSLAATTTTTTNTTTPPKAKAPATYFVPSVSKDDDDDEKEPVITQPPTRPSPPRAAYFVPSVSKDDDEQEEDEPQPALEPAPPIPEPEPSAPPAPAPAPPAQEEEQVEGVLQRKPGFSSEVITLKPVGASRRGQRLPEEDASTSQPPPPPTLKISTTSQEEYDGIRSRPSTSPGNAQVPPSPSSHTSPSWTSSSSPTKSTSIPLMKPESNATPTWMTQASSSNASSSTTTTPKVDLPKGGACYLVYDAVKAELNIHYSEVPIVGAVGVWTTPHIKAFKEAQGLGTSELIGNCAQNVNQDRAQYHHGWTQFIIAAKSMEATVTILQGVGVPVDIHTYVHGTAQVVSSSVFETESVDAVACVPRHTMLEGKGKKWLKAAKKAGGAVAVFSNLSALDGPATPSPATKQQQQQQPAPSPSPAAVQQAQAFSPPSPAEPTISSPPPAVEPVPAAPPVVDHGGFASAMEAPCPDTGACYLVYEPDSSGRLVEHYSKTPVPEAIGRWVPAGSKSIAGFKFKQNAGRKVLIGSCSAGVQGRKNYASGWCQYVRSARVMEAEVMLWDPVAKGLMVDVYLYQDDARPIHQTVKLLPGVAQSVEKTLAVACIPKNTPFYEGMTVDILKWLADGSNYGASSRFE